MHQSIRSVRVALFDTIASAPHPNKLIDKRSKCTGGFKSHVDQIAQQVLYIDTKRYNRTRQSRQIAIALATPSRTETSICY
jgi:hypothetical protein